ncbi:Uncharacterised protein [Vibrio cholerae]|nr:Uncharacterised protein [Vibrio cholerae]
MLRAVITWCWHKVALICSQTSSIQRVQSKLRSRSWITHSAACLWNRMPKHQMAKFRITRHLAAPMSIKMVQPKTISELMIRFQASKGL